MGSCNYRGGAVRKPGETVQGQAPPQSDICTVSIEKFAESYIGSCWHHRGRACEPNATILNEESKLL
jgi:hypothetical protein